MDTLNENYKEGIMKEFKTVEEIKKERLSLRKAGHMNECTLLGVVLAELDRRPDLTKESTEQDIYKVIKKLYDAAIECGNESEIEYLSQFIKKQLTDAELEDIIRSYKSKGYSMGEIMKTLSQDYSGQYDGKKAAQIIKNIL